MNCSNMSANMASNLKKELPKTSPKVQRHRSPAFLKFSKQAAIIRNAACLMGKWAPKPVCVQDLRNCLSVTPKDLCFTTVASHDKVKPKGGRRKPPTEPRDPQAVDHRLSIEITKINRHSPRTPTGSPRYARSRGGPPESKEDQSSPVPQIGQGRISVRTSRRVDSPTCYGTSYARFARTTYRSPGRTSVAENDQTAKATTSSKNDESHRKIMNRSLLLQARQTKPGNPRTPSTSPHKPSSSRDLDVGTSVMKIQGLAKEPKPPSYASRSSTPERSPRGHTGFRKDSSPGRRTSTSSQEDRRTTTVRSKTSTGHYPTPQDNPNERSTKSARLLRRETAQLVHQSEPSDVICQEQSAKLDGYIIDDNLPKFTSVVSQLPRNTKQAVINYKSNPRGSSSVFFRAVQLARVRFVELMLRECMPQLEVTGVFTIQDDDTLYQVTPLWYATVSGNFDLVRLLVNAGADVNAVSATGSSVLQAACSLPNVPIIKYLLLHGANINVDEANGVTCLMTCVQNLELIRVFAAQGSKINAVDREGNTALHYAARDGRISSVKLLLELGANPLPINAEGCNVLQTAAKNRHAEIVEFLLKRSSPKLIEIIEVYEVLGAMMVIMESDHSSGLMYWQKAMTLKELNKRKMPPRRGAGSSVLADVVSIREISTVDELNAVVSDRQTFFLQALLAYERIRGAHHENYLSLLIHRGAVSADARNYRLAVNLWRVAYTLYVEKYCIDLENNKIEAWNPNILRSLQFSIKAIHQSRLQLSNLSSDAEFESLDKYLVPEQTVTAVFRLMVNHISKAVEKDIFTCGTNINQSFSTLLKVCVCLYFTYLESFSRSERTEHFGSALKRLVQLNPRTDRGETLLHLCFNAETLDYLSSRSPDADVKVVLHAVVEILLQMGLCPLTADHSGNSFLHAAAEYHRRTKFSDPAMFQMMLRRGAHADQVNHHDQTAADLLATDDDIRPILARISLKCLSARVIAAADIPYRGEVPESLYSFIKLHGCV